MTVKAPPDRDYSFALPDECPHCKSDPFVPFLRFMVCRSLTWRDAIRSLAFWRRKPRPNSAVICQACKDIVGWEF